jgi:hypothetical protein
MTALVNHKSGGREFTSTDGEAEKERYYLAYVAALISSSARATVISPT